MGGGAFYQKTLKWGGGGNKIPDNKKNSRQELLTGEPLEAVPDLLIFKNARK